MGVEPVPASLFPVTTELRADGASVGGVDLRGLAATYGTPLFVYDEETLRARCREAARCLRRRCGVRVQVLPLRRDGPPGLRGGTLHRRGDRWGTRLVLRSGVPAGRIIMHGNNKSAEEMERAIAVGVHRLVVDNFEEIALLATLVERGVATRLPGTRDARGRGAHARVRAHRSRGHQVRFLCRDRRREKGDRGTAARFPGLTLHGVHAHIGSQVFEVDRLHRVARRSWRTSSPRTISTSCVSAGDSASPTSPGSRRRRSTNGVDAMRVAARMTWDSTRTCDCSPNRAGPSSPRRP